MGKALVFDSIGINDFLGKIDLSLNDGMNTVVRNYVNKLSSAISDAQIEALMDFYTTLENAGLWNNIAYFYPMFGNVKDCAYGLKGEDLIIPEGSVYNKGIDLTNAEGGFGYLGKGIRIGNAGLLKDSTQNYALIFNLPYGIDENTRGWVYTMGDLISQGEEWRSGGFGYSTLQFNATIGPSEVYLQKGYKGVFAETHKFGAAPEHKLYNNNVVLSSVVGQYSSIDKYADYFAINASPQSHSSHLVNVPLNMILVYKDIYLDESMMYIVSEAIGKLSKVLFE